MDNGARKAFAVRSLGVSSMELDERGLLMACPNCGKRNRLRYEGLGRTFRCGQCKTEIHAPDQPIDVGSDLAFDALIGRSALPVLVDFWAPWCGPCRMVAPEFAKVAKDTAGTFAVAKVNTEELPGLSARFRVTAIPTRLVFNGGRDKARQAGAMPAPAIRKFVEQAVSSR